MHTVSTLADVRFWDRAARKYAADPIADVEGYERTLARTLDLLGPTDRVLEIGCGTGTTALRIAPHVAHMTGTDASSQMIAIAREKTADALRRGITFTVAAASDDMASAAPFDAVLAFNVLHLVADRPATYAAIRRLVRPGGLFVSKTTCLKEMSALIRMGIPVARMIGKAPWVDVFDGPELEAEIAAAGFIILERDRHGSKPRDPRLFVVARVP